MKKFIGTKVVNATPMSRGDYNIYRGWSLPANENGADKGYLVEYRDGGAPNVVGHDGYVSWSPVEQFYNAYRESDGLPIGLAIEALKKGSKITRLGWNASGMWLMLVPALLAEKVAFEYGALGGAPWIGLKNAHGDFVPWQPSVGDTLADDWAILS